MLSVGLPGDVQGVPVQAGLAELVTGFRECRFRADWLLALVWDAERGITR